VPDYGTDPENTTYNDYTDAIIGKDGKHTDLYPIATDLHKRAHTIGPVLVDCEAVEVYHTGRRSTSAAYTKVPVTFNRVDLYPTGEGVSFAAQFPTGIRISVAFAEKPDEWTVIYEASGMTRPTTEVPVIRFDPVTASRIKLESDRSARFVRIVALKLTGGYEPNLGGHLMQISEIEVYWN
jgi:hypothetical protein